MRQRFVGKEGVLCDAFYRAEEEGSGGGRGVIDGTSVELNSTDFKE
jgi:hypothetical protein